MIALTTWIGSLLVATGAAAYAATGGASATAFIPSGVGVLLLVAAVVAHRWERARRHAMHAALLVAVLAVAGSVPNVAGLGEVFDGTAERPGAVVASTVMLVLLVVYLVAGVRSFIRARRSAESEPATP